MHFKWNKSFSRALASSAVALLATSSLYAIPKAPCEPKQDICCQEPPPGPFAFAYPMDVGLSCPRDFYFHIDGLAFQAKQDGMEFALFDSNGPTAGPLTHGRIEGFSNDHTSWDYNPGMRFGVGFYLDHDAWNLDFNWTWLNITEYKSASAGSSGGSIVPLWLLGIGTPTAQIGSRAGANWEVSYNTLDAVLAKPYHVSRYLIFNPFFGIRVGWIDQHYSQDYGGLQTSSSAGSGRTVHHGDNDFWGVGARVGINTDWLLGKGWMLFANISTSMLAGRFEVDQSLSIPGNVNNDGFDIKFDYYQNTPNIEMALGLGWGKFFDKGKYHFGAKAAYEFSEWFNQLNMRKFFSGSGGVANASGVNAVANTAGVYANDTVSRGNFTLNGFSLRVQLDI